MADDELRQRGAELQAALPEPSEFASKWFGRRERVGRSEGKELAEATVDAWAGLGLLGLLLAVPAGIVWLVRRLRD